MIFFLCYEGVLPSGTKEKCRRFVQRRCVILKNSGCYDDVAF